MITVEPGLYFIPALIDQWKSKKQTPRSSTTRRSRSSSDARGCRIEDDVLVTAAGGRVLGPPIPKTVAEVEAACRE